MFADRGFLLFGEATYVRLAVRVCLAVDDVFDTCSFALKSHFEYRFGFGSWILLDLYIGGTDFELKYFLKDCPDTLPLNKKGSEQIKIEIWSE